MTIRSTLVCAVAVACLAAPAVTAQPGAWSSRGDALKGAYDRGTPVQALPTPFSNGGSCVPWCVADATPCDPDAYKLADRRCNINQNGYFPK